MESGDAYFFYVFLFYLFFITRIMRGPDEDIAGFALQISEEILSIGQNLKLALCTVLNSIVSNCELLTAGCSALLSYVKMVSKQDLGSRLMLLGAIGGLRDVSRNERKSRRTVSVQIFTFLVHRRNDDSTSYPSVP